MWTEIVDGQGRKRGMIFYKAAFYDQRAHAHLECRFSLHDDYATPLRSVSVRDACGKVEKEITGLVAPDWNGDRDEALRCNRQCEVAAEELRAWLNEDYPEWRSPLAYWEEWK